MEWAESLSAGIAPAVAETGLESHQYDLEIAFEVVIG